MGVFDKILRTGEGKKVRALKDLVTDVNDLESDYEALSDADLRGKTDEFRRRVAEGREAGQADQDILNDLLIEAFAVVREGAKRVLNQRHYDEQLMGGAALHFGWIAEMKTGEGKTLVSTLPVYLNALTGRGVHLVTVNDYLAAFHAEWMGRLHRFLGLTVGLVSPDIDDWQQKKAAYACDITYGTNTEFGFDYLRDNMARSKDAMAQRGHVYAIVDEVDSILIDEARTPLIISGPAAESARLYHQFAGIARSMRRDVDYEVDEEKRTVVVTDEGIDKVEQALGVDNLYDLVAVNYVHQLENALRAKELYRRDKEYIVDGGEVKIVDEFTGRILDGRRWSDGLHQAVEAKERVAVKEENHTWATVTLQNFFRLYDKLAGMTGTAETDAAEFANTYNLPVVPIPTHRPMIRLDQADVIYKTEAAKFSAAVEDIAERYERGQPVLIGTASVEKSEILSRLLEKRGIPHAVLNAKTAASGQEHAKEANIIAQAGRLHGVTVSTNMAGRGVDILLGGNPEGLARQEAVSRLVGKGVDLRTPEGLEQLEALYRELLPEFEGRCKSEGDEVRELGGLYVLGSERHESRRIDNQLRGRAGRQGDPGESRFYLSLEDELLRLFATGAMSWVMGKALPDDVPIEAKMVTRAIEKAQGTVEARNAESRKDVLKYDEVFNQQRKVVYGRRMQVLDGEDLREHTVSVLEDTVTGLVDTYCPGDYTEDWDVDGLVVEAGSFWPTKFDADELAQATGREHLTASLLAEATAFYEAKERDIPGGTDVMREVERSIMLQLLDQKWREHLAEMDYLRVGIHLRAMGQQDPLTAWQKEGFDMFTRMMSNVDADYLKYVMHAEVTIEQPAEPDMSQAEFIAADDPVQPVADAADPGDGVPPGVVPFDVGGIPGGPAVSGPLPPSSPASASPGGPQPPQPVAQVTQVAPIERPDLGGTAVKPEPPSPVPVAPAAAPSGGGGAAVDANGFPESHAPIVRAEHEKLGRNQPCFCGSGKKYKLCHGR